MGSALITAARVALARYRARQDGNDQRVVTFPPGSLLELSRAVAGAAHQSVLQIVPFEPATWRSDAFEHVIWREVSRAGVHVRRLYIVPHAGLARDRLGEHLREDIASGIEARLLVIGALPQSEQIDQLDGLWIVDGAAAVVASRSPDGSGGPIWTVSEREEDVRNGSSYWNRIWSWSSDLEVLGNGSLDLEEPLVLSADIISGVAPVLCTYDHVDRRTCTWYHSSWQYLRLLDMVSTPTWHSGFYTVEIHKAVETLANPEVLITGTADYSMLAYAHFALQNKATRANIHVVDLCPTPLLACRWYANRNGIVISTYEDDILCIDRIAGASIDVICTDAFLTRFKADAACRVVEVWARFLRPGGTLVTTVRIHGVGSEIRDRDAAIMDFRERALHRAKRWAPFLKKSPTEISEMAEQYARRMLSEDLGGEDQVCEIIESGGFGIVTRRLKEVPGELYPTMYLELACRRLEG